MAAIVMFSGAAAHAETRTLTFHHLHTGETLSITYKRDGRYISSALDKINWELRDWRMKQQIKMDPRLLDLIWEAYRQSGSGSPIQVVCGYRSPTTNSMLRSRSAGVAKESQHMLGRALDFYLPDVPLKKMREIGLKMQIGGVGYYPRSGSPFVHFDVGNARHWPKMSRQELLAVFPNGNTVHVPSDGRPLPGYEQALASYRARKGNDAIQVANAGSAPASRSGGGKTLFAMIFGGGGGADEEEDSAEVEVAQKPAPARVIAPPAAAVPAPVRQQKSEIAVAAMLPSGRPNLLAAGVPLPIRDTFDIGAPTPRAGIPATAPAAEPEETAVAALDISRIPLPRFAPQRAGVETDTSDETVASISAVAKSLDAAKAMADDSQADVPAPASAALIAALEASPAGRRIGGQDIAEAPAADQLAYAVPTPRARPPFDALLKTPVEVASNSPSPESIDEVKRILEAASDAPAQPSASALVTETASVRLSNAGGALTAALNAAPAAKPAVPSTAADRSMLIAAVEAPRPAVELQKTIIAATATPSIRPAETARVSKQAASAQATKSVHVAAAEPMRLAAVLAQKPKASALAPAGKTGRLSRTAPPEAASAKALSTPVTDGAVEVAALVADPGARAGQAMTHKPNAIDLVRNVPTSVFTAGFTPHVATGAANRFVGTAVNFLPVAKFD